MVDGYIEDFQLTSSSSSPGRPIGEARPGSIGWCSAPEDKDLFIQVFTTYIVYILLKII